MMPKDTPNWMKRWDRMNIALTVGLLLFMLRSGTAGKVAAIFFLTPGLSAVLGWLVLGEGLAPAAVVCFSIV